MTSLENRIRLSHAPPSVSARDDGRVSEAAHVPRVSVIIPTYNSGAMVRDAIQSVLAQTYSDFEIVVVDDGSTDNTESVVRQFSRRARYFKQENQGVSTARNVGIRKSVGEYLAFLDSDDLWSPEKLAEQVPLLDCDPELGLVYSDWALASDQGIIQTSYLRDLPCRSGYVFDDLIQSGFILTSGVVVRRACLEAAGDFDKSLAIAQDYDLWLRISYRWKVALVNKPLLIKRSCDGSLSSDLTKTAMERIALYKKVLRDIPGMTERSRKLVRRQLAVNYWDVGYAYFDRLLLREARKNFMSSVTYDWKTGKALAYLAASYLPSSFVRAVRSVKRATT
jgi:glycosyltransferase involved in cell wall biosynthesis